MTDLVLRLEHLDRRLLMALATRRRPRLDRWMREITRLGDPVVMLASGSLLLFGAGLLPIPPEVAREAALGILLSNLFGQLVKRRVARARPILPVGLHSLVEPPDRFSFPSGHAAAGLALVLPISLWLALPWGLPLLVIGLAIGVSRAYLGVHYPGDVVAGWGLAGFAAILLNILG